MNQAPNPFSSGNASNEITLYTPEASTGDDKRETNEAANALVESLGASNEELANCLQKIIEIAADPAQRTDPERIRYQARSVSKQRVSGAGVDGQTPFALLCDARSYRVANQHSQVLLTAVNMFSGDEFTFSTGSIDAIRKGEYADDAVSVEDTLAYVYGLACTAGAPLARQGDPLVTMTKQKQGEALVLDATLTNLDQVERLGRLITLENNTCKNARIRLAPATAAELVEIITHYATPEALPYIESVVTPPDTIALNLANEDEHYNLTTIVKQTSSWSAEAQHAVFDAISAIDVRVPGDLWTPIYNAKQIVERSIVAKDGAPEVQPVASLAKKLICDRYDFGSAVFSAAGGYFSEGFLQSPTGAGSERHVTQGMDEEWARMFATVFAERLMDIVDQARLPLDIPDTLPAEDQILALLHNYGYIEKGVRLVLSPVIMSNHPEVTPPQWAAVCKIVDRWRTSKPTEADNVKLETFNINPTIIATEVQYTRSQTAEDIVQNALGRRRL